MLTVTLVVVLVILVGVAAMVRTRRVRPTELEHEGSVHALGADARSPLTEAERDVMQDRPGAH